MPLSGIDTGYDLAGFEFLVELLHGHSLDRSCFYFEVCNHIVWFLGRDIRMDDWFHKIWNDPVAAGLIAAAILAVISTIWAGIQFKWWKRFRAAWTASLKNEEEPKLPATPPTTNVRVINVTAPPPPKQGLSYPLKCYVEFRNSSAHPIEVRFSNYEAIRIPSQKMLFNVLQILFGHDDWVPKDEVDWIAVLPDQHFRIWLPVDEKHYTPEQILGFLGNIGKVTLRINNDRFEFRI